LTTNAADSTPATRLTGTVVAAHGRNFLVELSSGEFFHCVTRGKEKGLACGDTVDLSCTAPGQGVIESLHARQTLFQRASAFRDKLIAANATQLALISATEPSFSDELLARAICVAEDAGLKVLLILNKCDLTPSLNEARERISIFSGAKYPVLELSALDDVTRLRPFIEAERTVLAGQSGMGKSTIIQQLFPEENVATRSISHFLSSGRHTTTAARLYRLGEQSWIVDSPGMKEFGLAHWDRRRIENTTLEFRPFLGQCRFQDCRHGPEPGCALRLAVERGELNARRFELFHRIVAAP
jgi:ribosome biogenesis GTPase / thiamine phosphate phosphatase